MPTHDGPLLALALAAIGGLVLLITWCRLNPFLALLLAALGVGLGAVLLGQTVPDASGRLIPYSLLGVARSLQSGLGDTLGGIAAVLALGTMLGRLLAESGGAEVLAEVFNARFGPTRATWVIVLLALAVGLATWFTVGLLLLAPILVTLTRVSGRPFLHLALPMLAFLSTMHGLMPPHPGPVVAVETLRASMGHVLLWGFVVGIPTAFVAGPVLARFATRWVTVTVRVPEPARVPAPAESSATPRRPGFALTLFTILLPVVLMVLVTVRPWLGITAGRAAELLDFAGHPTVALLISVLFALWSFGRHCGHSAARLLTFTEASVASVGMTILIVGGGGAFARVLRDSGVAAAIGRYGEAAQLSPLLYGWLVAVFIRVATGSATVAITTASGLLVPVLAAHPELGPSQVALIVVALGSGSLFLSHLNDGGFWIVKDALGLTVAQTFKTWSVSETMIGVLGMLLAWACYAAL